MLTEGCLDLPELDSKAANLDLIVGAAEIFERAVLVRASQIVIGTDFGFPIADSKPVDTILQTPGLSADEQMAILGGNAERLLRLRG